MGFLKSIYWYFRKKFAVKKAVKSFGHVRLCTKCDFPLDEGYDSKSTKDINEESVHVYHHICERCGKTNTIVFADHIQIKI